MSKPNSNLARVDFLAYLDGLWYGVYLGRVAENLPFELLINDVVVLQVVIRKHTGENYRHSDEHNQGRPDHGVAGKKALGRTGSTIRNSDFNGHNSVGADASLQLLDDDARGYRYPTRKLPSLTKKHSTVRWWLDDSF